MDNQTESREQFEKMFKSEWHPDRTGPYVKYLMRFAWEKAWQASRAAIVVDLEGVGYVQVEEGAFYLSESGVNENLRSIGLTVKE